MSFQIILLKKKMRVMHKSYNMASLKLDVMEEREIFLCISDWKSFWLEWSRSECEVFEIKAPVLIGLNDWSYGSMLFLPKIQLYKYILMIFKLQGKKINTHGWVICN